MKFWNAGISFRKNPVRGLIQSAKIFDAVNYSQRISENQAHLCPDHRDGVKVKLWSIFRTHW